MPPKRSTAASIAASASARLVTSSLTTSRWAESPSAWATVPGLRPVATTLWPAASAALAMSTPMPRPAPVMSQVFVLVVMAFTSCQSRALSRVRGVRRAGRPAGGSGATGALHGQGGQRDEAGRDHGDAEGGGAGLPERGVEGVPADRGAGGDAAVEGRDGERGGERWGRAGEPDRHAAGDGRDGHGYRAEERDHDHRGHRVGRERDQQSEDEPGGQRAGDQRRDRPAVGEATDAVGADHRADAEAHEDQRHELARDAGARGEQRRDEAERPHAPAHDQNGGPEYEPQAGAPQRPELGADGHRLAVALAGREAPDHGRGDDGNGGERPERPAPAKVLAGQGAQRHAQHRGESDAAAYH